MSIKNILVSIVTSILLIGSTATSFATENIIYQEKVIQQTPVKPQINKPERGRDVIWLPASGVFGRIVIEPTCPVVQRYVPCSRPFQGTVVIKTQEGNSEINRFTSDRNGKFKISLAPGTYLFEPLSPSKIGIPRGIPQIVRIEPGMYTGITIVYDSGIR